MKKCKVCKKPMVPVKAIGKLRTTTIGWYCFKDYRFVPDPTKVKVNENNVSEEFI